MIQIGDARLHFVNDGTFWTDAGGLFGLVPRVLWERIVTPDDLNRIPMSMRCLLIESQGKRILVDTGYGDKLTEKWRRILNLQGDRRLVADLARIGFEPEDIDIVICTHLHGDHISGNTVWTEDGEAIPTFPNAEYWVQRLELADARYPNERTEGTYFQENFEPLENAGQLHLIDGDTAVTGDVYTSITAGHTRSHQSVFIESGGEAAVYLGDTAQGYWAFEHMAWVPAYDVEPLVSIQTKKRLARWVLRQNATMIFEHDPNVACARLEERDDGRFNVVPEVTEPAPESP